MNKKITQYSVFSTKQIGFFLGFLSLLLNLFSLYLHSKINLQDASLPLITWILSVLFLGLSIFILSPSKKKEKITHENLTLIEKIFFVGILLVGLILRIYKLDHLGLFRDEWFWLTNARGILDGVIKTPFGFIGDQPSNMPAYIVAFFLAIFKNSYLAVRLPGVLYSFLNIILIFSFLREAFNKKIALVAILLMSLSIWDIHMSQFGWNNVNLNPFLISGTLFFLYKSIKDVSFKHIFFCGIFLGLSINLLYIAALSTIAVVFYFLYQYLINTDKKKIVCLFLVLILTAFVVSSPTIIKIYKYPQQSIARHKNFVSENITYSKNQTGIFYYLEQLRLGAEDFTYKPEKFNIIALWGITLEPFVFYCFIIGLVYSLRYIARPPFFLIFLNYVIMFIPIVILYRTTSVWREFGFLPTIYMLASIGIYVLHKLISRFVKFIALQKQEIRIRNLILVIIITTYFVSWYYFYSRYYENHLKKDPNVYETYCKKTAEYLSDNVPPKTVLLLPDEMCKDLIMISLWDQYDYKVYNDTTSLHYLIQTNEHGLIVKIPYINATSFFTRIIFDDKDLDYTDNKTLDKFIVQDDNILYAYIYKF